jgi:hypothetical protein
MRPADGGGQSGGANVADDDEDVTEAGAPDSGDRLDRVEHKVDALAELIQRIIPKARAASAERVEARLDRPTTVEEQVQAELARAEKERKEDERKAGVDARLTALETPKPPPEQPPAPPVPLRRRILGWGE